MSERSKVIGIIPARYESSRFPGKVLADIAGKPMIQRVYEQVIKSELLDSTFIAVDDEKVLKCAEEFGAPAVMTYGDHKSGTDRIAEAVENIDAEIIVNIQGDQPLLDPLMIDEAIKPLVGDDSILMSTLKVKIKPEDYLDPAVVKVVTDENDFALYFSRSLIPYSRDKRTVDVFEHIGIYAYRKDFLIEFSRLPQSELEQVEMLEQLRVLEKGYKIKVIETKSKSAAGVSVDTKDDLIRVEKLIQSAGIK